MAPSGIQCCHNSQWVGGWGMDQSMGSVAKEKQILFQEFQGNLQSLSTWVLSLLGCYLDDFDAWKIKDAF